MSKSIGRAWEINALYSNWMCIFRTSKESMSDGVTLSNDDAQRLLRAMKEFMQITSEEQAQQTADGNKYDSF